MRIGLGYAAEMEMEPTRLAKRFLFLHFPDFKQRMIPELRVEESESLFLLKSCEKESSYRVGPQDLTPEIEGKSAAPELGLLECCLASLYFRCYNFVAPLCNSYRKNESTTPVKGIVN